MSTLTYVLFNKLNNFLDVAMPWQTTFQDPATPTMEGIINFHHDLMFILILIVVFVSWMIARCVYFFNINQNKAPSALFVHGTALEIIWTITPALILFTIAIPSFALLYSIDELIEPTLTLKVIGHQWYWSYEILDKIKGENINFDSYMIPENELTEGNFRLLEVDNRVILPVDTHIRLLITAADVLHCWAIPSLGVKLDACPGRLNQTAIFIKRPGVFYGQCSEICGVNHGFMPIVIEAVSYSDYLSWLFNKYQNQ
jgi:cytochrome c oxidase subunit 2